MSESVQSKSGALVRSGKQLLIFWVTMETLFTPYINFLFFFFLFGKMYHGMVKRISRKKIDILVQSQPPPSNRKQSSHSETAPSLYLSVYVCHWFSPLLPLCLTLSGSHATEFSERCVVLRLRVSK